MAQAKRKEAEETAPAEPQTAAPTAWQKPEALSRRGLLVIAAIVVALNLPMLHYYLVRSQQAPTATVPFSDDFSDQSHITANYFSTGGLWRIEDGWLLSPGVKNNPLWLKADLPQNVSIEFDCKSMSPEGDIKVEVFGDGTDHASGYVLIHGGWNNSLSIIARRDEHGRSLQSMLQEAQQVAQRDGKPSGLVESGVFKEDARMRVEAAPYPVQIGKTYHWKIERRGSVLTWFIDGTEFMRFDDPIPLVGKGHNRMGFSSWEAQLYFDNLKITPL